MEARISNQVRRQVYRRDGWRCALCDSTDGIQVHHVEPRGRGGSSEMWNLITLCWRCHALAHGSKVIDGSWMEQEDVELGCIEYLSDFYAEEMQRW